MLFDKSSRGLANLNIEVRKQRPRVIGKFIFIGDEKFYLKGVTYGTFKPDENGHHFPSPERIRQDFRMMRENGINTVRTYTPPPIYLLQIAFEFDLRVMVGLPWEQHINFLESEERVQNILEKIKTDMKDCINHPSVLCYTIGNEIPAPIVRMLGALQTEKFLFRIYSLVKSIDPEALVTYVNFPTTEYLQLPFLDFVSFNVYLETREKLESYLQRLHNLAGDLPLVMAEIGLDSLRNGPERQAEILQWQIHSIFSKGCAGAFVFAWTDEWWRGGFDILDWDFGLVDRERNAKPALEVISRAYANLPVVPLTNWPFISVVICTYNGSATIRDSLEALKYLDYPNFEVFVINDGSTDNTESIVREYPVKLISTTNQGLSNARNTGMNLSKGEIVAYLDDDAYPDPQWLKYLAYAFSTTSHAGIGGPNIIPEEDGFTAVCIANSPGGPIHVLLTDEIAEHIPGCNMAFRRDVLLEIGGFDPIFRSAGDDVDLCWRIQHIGKSIGYHPSALVWHHRRDSVWKYWKQQKGYGKAEALLEQKWPEKYNGFGHLTWAGRIYGNGTTKPVKLKRDKIFYGIWGSALFQSLYQTTPSFISFIPLMPEWHLLIAIIGFLCLLGLSWSPLLFLLPVFVFMQAIIFTQAGLSAASSLETKKIKTFSSYFKHWLLITALHVLQPAARLYGRIFYGLTPWRKRGSESFKLKYMFTGQHRMSQWSETWKSSENWLTDIEAKLIASKTCYRKGGYYDSWDLQSGAGIFVASRGLLTVEEHGAQKQMLRFDCKSSYSVPGVVVILLFAVLTILSSIDHSYIATIILGFFTILLISEFFIEKALSLSDLVTAFESQSANINAELNPRHEKIFQTDFLLRKKRSELEEVNENAVIV